MSSIAGFGLSGAMALIKERVPRSCRAGFELDNCKFMSPIEALGQKYRAGWDSGSMGLLVVDVDHTDAYGAVLEGRVPPPLVWVHNLTTGHFQPRYALRAPVDLTVSGPALDFLKDLRDDMAAGWGADIHFTGPMVRGEFWSEHQTEAAKVAAYSMGELRAMLPSTPRADTEREKLNAAAGRNCAAFDALRREAYEHLRQNPCGSTLRDFLDVRSVQINSRFSRPLRAAELAAIVRSITRWCLVHREEITRQAHRKAAKVPGANRSNQKYSFERESLPVAQQRANMSIGGKVARQSVADKNRECIRLMAAELRRTGKPVTTAEIMAVTGLSRATVKRHSDLWRGKPS